MGARAYLFKGIDERAGEYKAEHIYSHWGASYFEEGNTFNDIWEYETKEKGEKIQILDYDTVRKLEREKDISIELIAIQFINEFGIDLTRVIKREHISGNLYVDIEFSVHTSEINDRKRKGIKRELEAIGWVVNKLKGFFYVNSFLPAIGIPPIDLRDKEKVKRLIKIFLKNELDKDDIMPAVKVEVWENRGVKE